MTLDRDQTVVRYYIFLLRLYGSTQFEIDGRMERGTNLCSLFWGIAFRSLVLAFMAVAAIVITIAVVILILQNPWDVLMFIGFIVGFLAVVAVLVFSGRVAHKLAQSDNIVVSYIRSVKRGICPLITFKNGETK